MNPHSPIGDAILLLARYKVDNILVGGAAMILHGSAYVTQDVDFCCKWDDRMLSRLAAALNSVHSKLRVLDSPEGVAVNFDVKYLRQFSSIALDTDIGLIDVRKAVDGIGSYSAVLDASEEHQFGELSIRLLSIDGLIQSKTHMARSRDMMVLPELHLMREAQKIKSLDIGRGSTSERDGGEGRSGR